MGIRATVSWGGRDYVFSEGADIFPIGFKPLFSNFGHPNYKKQYDTMTDDFIDMIESYKILKDGNEPNVIFVGDTHPKEKAKAKPIIKKEKTPAKADTEREKHIKTFLKRAGIVVKKDNATMSSIKYLRLSLAYIKFTASNGKNIDLTDNRISAINNSHISRKKISQLMRDNLSRKIFRKRFAKLTKKQQKQIIEKSTIEEPHFMDNSFILGLSDVKNEILTSFDVDKTGIFRKIRQLGFTVKRGNDFAGHRKYKNMLCGHYTDMVFLGGFAKLGKAYVKKWFDFRDDVYVVCKNCGENIRMKESDEEVSINQAFKYSESFKERIHEQLFTSYFDDLIKFVKINTDHEATFKKMISEAVVPYLIKEVEKYNLKSNITLSDRLNFLKMLFLVTISCSFAIFIQNNKQVSWNVRDGNRKQNIIKVGLAIILNKYKNELSKIHMTRKLYNTVYTDITKKIRLISQKKIKKIKRKAQIMDTNNYKNRPFMMENHLKLFKASELWAYIINKQEVKGIKEYFGTEDVERYWTAGVSDSSSRPEDTSDIFKGVLPYSVYLEHKKDGHKHLFSLAHSKKLIKLQNGKEKLVGKDVDTSGANVLDIQCSLCSFMMNSKRYDLRRTRKDKSVSSCYVSMRNEHVFKGGFCLMCGYNQYDDGTFLVKWKHELAKRKTRLSGIVGVESDEKFSNTFSRVQKIKQKYQAAQVVSLIKKHCPSDIRVRANVITHIYSHMEENFQALKTNLSGITPRLLKHNLGMIAGIRNLIQLYLINQKGRVLSMADISKKFGTIDKGDGVFTNVIPEILRGMSKIDPHDLKHAPYLLNEFMRLLNRPSIATKQKKVFCNIVNRVISDIENFAVHRKTYSVRDDKRLKNKNFLPLIESSQETIDTEGLVDKSNPFNYEIDDEFVEPDFEIDKSWQTDY